MSVSKLKSKSKISAGWCCKAAGACLALAALVSPALAQPAPQADFTGRPASAEARRAASIAITAGDAQGLPFAVVDKKAARLYVFRADGRLAGDTAVLVGATPGDRYIPNLNQRDLSRLGPDERTTPAGRFVSEPGHNLQGEAVVWVDYDSAFAIHRLRPAPARERRPQRLASPVAAEHRISLGCVITSVAFYESVVQPVLGATRAVIYVLPESPDSPDLFSAL